MKNRTGYFLFIVLILFSASGAHCLDRLRPLPKPDIPPPRVLPPNPTLTQVIDVVNRNRALVTSLVANNARLSGPGFPSMRASVAIGPSRHFRLRAGTGLGGDELDIGSTPDLFWLWAKRNDPPATYIGRHDRRLTAGGRAVLPVGPEWFVEALGLVHLDPDAQHKGPFQMDNNRLKIQTTLPSPDGNLTRITMIDGWSGYVLKQFLLDPAGALLAVSTTSRHEYDPRTDIGLPRQIDIDLPSAGIAFTLHLDDIQINPLHMQPALWQKPEYPGYPVVELNNPQGRSRRPARTAG